VGAADDQRPRPGPPRTAVIWDADFLYVPQTAAGDDTFVLCEINVSAVWPFPPMAAPTVAAAALVRTQGFPDAQVLSSLMAPSCAADMPVP
jgi:hypothetical protein